jgi:ParB-like chromosome segregation protein Spo0J
LLKDEFVNIEDIYIQVRKGKGRYVLVEGLHRLEACRSLGDVKVICLIVSAKKF